MLIAILQYYGKLNFFPLWLLLIFSLPFSVFPKFANQEKYF